MSNRILTVGPLDPLALAGADLLARPDLERVHAAEYSGAPEQARSLRPSLVLIDGSNIEAAVSLIRSLRSDPATGGLKVAVLLPSASDAAERALQDVGADEVLIGVLDSSTWDARLERMLSAPRRLALVVRVAIRNWLAAQSPDALWGEALNLSSGGMLLETEVALEIGSKLDLRFVLPGTTEELRAMAQVVRRAGFARERWLSGVEFLVLRGQTRERIDTYMQQAAGLRTEALGGGPQRGRRQMTERTSWEAQLRASEARKHAILDSVFDAIVTINHDGRVFECNRATERIFGYSRAELLGRPALETLAPSLRLPERGGLAALSDAKGPDPFETKGLRKDGSEFPMEMAIAPVVAEAGRLFTACLRDISQRQRLESQLRQAQKMDAVGRLAGGVAHDFNNLLNVILGYAELLRGSLPVASREARRALEIERAAARAAELTRQLLAFSRKQPQQRVVLDLNAVVEQAREMLGRLIGEHYELVTELDPDLGRVFADRGQIEQVLTNLVVNARDAMPGGGRVLVRTRNVELDSSYVRHHEGAHAGPHVLLEVEDKGAGMDAETLRRLFEPFFTTKELGKGTGLGLATVYGIVKQSQGYVAVESSPGQGARFSVLLPRLVGEARAAEPTGQAPAAAPAASGGRTVLVVEDQEMLRALVCEVLEGAGYRVLTARDGEEALRVSAAHAGSIDLLLADVVMPNMSGPELARRLSAVRPEMKVLLASGYPREVASGQAELGPDTPFLQKPFTTTALEAKVREVLGQN